MPVSRKMAQWMSKQIKEAPKEDPNLKDPNLPDLKELAKQEMAAIEMVSMSKKELEELSKGRGRKAEAASDEIARRIAKKELKKGNPDVHPDLAGTPSASDYRKFREGVYNKGGMVKKKPAAKKAPAKTKSRSSPYNKNYGK